MSITPQLIGREEELSAIVRLLDAREHLPAAVLVKGEAGVGKTTLWLAGIDAASARGYRILRARPSEAESSFSFGGLTDLLRDDVGDVLPGLPPIQQRALKAALLLGDSELAVDERAISAAVLAVLLRIASDGPVCLAIDDVQWLDAATLAALRYALARLEHEPVVAMLAVRGHMPAWLRRTVPYGRLRTVGVGGLSVGATYELLRGRLDVTFARPTLIRLWEASRGNPFFALELATALQQRGGTLAPGEELPITSDLGELLHTRIESLGATAREIAGFVAALAEPTVDLVEALLGARTDSGLAEALQERILELDGDRLRFAHPLLASAVVALQTPGRRRDMHARLADIVRSPEERARHLALATRKPEQDVASTLEEAARTAQARGASAAAAELAEQALRLTPHSCTDDARRRLLVAADMHRDAGDIDRATALLEPALAGATPGNERAIVLTHLASVQASPQSAVALYRQALSETEDDAALQARIHVKLASLMRYSDGILRGVEHGELAVRAASRAGDARLRCSAIAAYGLVRFNAGRGIPVKDMEDAVSLERSLANWPLDYGPTIIYGHQLWWAADVDRARTLFEEVRDVGEARNRPQLTAEALWFLSFLEWRGGNWEDAERHAGESVDLMTQFGRLLPPGELPTAVIDAHRGRVEDARARAKAAIGRAEAEGIVIAQSGHGWVLGFIELSLGDPVTALEHLRRAYTLRNDFALEPGMRLEIGDLLEALIAANELDEADEVLTIWEPRAAALDRAWALAVLARCRALLLAANGDFDGAFASFDTSLAQHARSIDPFQHARTLLALGRTQRRAKKRAAARTTLEDALSRFERLGAPLWAEQARAELSRIGGRAPSRGELTEAEGRIAELVASGHTNREVAAALFLTEHSVETALTRVYRKVGVRSRSELVRRLTANT